MLKITKFGATWCKPCSALEKTMMEILPPYDTKVEYKVVDIEEETELADQLQIRSVPTMILEKNGEVVLRFSGTKSDNELKKIIDRYV